MKKRTGVAVAVLAAGLTLAVAAPAQAAPAGSPQLVACSIGHDSSLRTAEGKCDKPAKKYRLTAVAVRKGKGKVTQEAAFLDSGWVKSPKMAKVTAPKGFKIVEDSIDIDFKVK